MENRVDTNSAAPKPALGKLGWVSQRPVIASAIVAALLLLMSLQLPKFARAWRTGGNVQSANNLAQMGLAIQLYSNENRGQYPDSLGTLLTTEDFTADALISPGSHDTPVRGATTQAIDNELAKGGHVSYHYLGRGLTSATADANAVIAYEDPGIWPNGGSVLCGDGHVPFVDSATLKMIAAKAESGVRPVMLPPSVP